jgi:hypothetical protein
MRDRPRSGAALLGASSLPALPALAAGAGAREGGLFPSLSSSDHVCWLDGGA